MGKKIEEILSIEGRRIYGVSYFETASQAGEAMLYLSDKLRGRE